MGDRGVVMELLQECADLRRSVMEHARNAFRAKLERNKALEAALAERNATVVFLRAKASYFKSGGTDDANTACTIALIANAIERGEHVKP